MTDQPTLRWHDPEWQAQAHAWIHEQAHQHAMQVSGAIEQNHAYAWATVMRVPTDTGMVFFKATAPETIYEIALTERLAAWFPDVTPDLIASDPTRGWMLMRDGGEPLRASIRPTKDVTLWEPIIVPYVELQMGLTAHVEDLLALGIPDHRPVALPLLFENLLADEASLMIGQEKGLTPDEFQQLQTWKARFAETCAEVAAFGIPDSLNHGDFHDANVLIKDGRITFFDWGDANVTHPFASIRTWLVSMEIALGLDDYAPPTPEMLRLLERYLAAWQAYGSQEALLSLYQLSRPAASISKALQWRMTISNLPTDLRPQYAWIVPEVLREFLFVINDLKA